ncbi:MAG: hypothetical protein K9L99_05830 [Candidatus Omnitrophica bacterium]|nr:hypothetical protein [Candidatus Omnitrophota bacterium]
MAKENKKEKKEGVNSTIRQKRTMEALVQSKGRKSLYKCMREAGYSQKSSENPKNILTRSKGWQQLCEEYLPDASLLSLHKKQLNSYKYIIVNGKKERVEDNKSRLKALDLAYRCKGKYAPTEVAVSKSKYSTMSNEELQETEKKLKKFLFKL